MVFFGMTRIAYWNKNKGKYCVKYCTHTKTIQKYASSLGWRLVEIHIVSGEINQFLHRYFPMNMLKQGFSWNFILMHIFQKLENSRFQAAGRLRRCSPGRQTAYSALLRPNINWSPYWNYSLTTFDNFRWQCNLSLTLAVFSK